MRETFEDFEREVDFLARFSSRMRVLGLALALITFLNFLTVLWYLISRHGFCLEVDYGIDFRVLISATLRTIAICIGVLHDFHRKRGEALFEEVSDELHWHIRPSGFGDADVATARPPLRVRVVLRSLVNSADLPLIPGGSEPLIIGSECHSNVYGCYFTLARIG